MEAFTLGFTSWQGGFLSGWYAEQRGGYLIVFGFLERTRLIGAFGASDVEDIS